MSGAGRRAAKAVECVDCADGAVPGEIWRSETPVKLAGLVRHWPAVRHCSASIGAAARYLGRFAIQAPVTAYAGDPSIGGRFFYNDDFTGFNFTRGKATIADILAKLAEPNREPRLATLYVGSTPVSTWLPGFRSENDVAVPAANALASFWFGNETRISAHYDFPDNLACVVAGKRRFTLLAPDEIGNLYVGPLEPTPSGQAISLVDFANPDFERHPRFAAAIARARTAELGPGDAIFIPSMWWHHVESLAPFNLLINYWWCATPDYLGAPSDALLHAILALRDLPPRQRAAWRGVFDHYVFEAGESAAEHIPEAARGALGALDSAAAKRLRATITNHLNR